MGDLNPVMEDTSAEVVVPGKRTSKPRVSVPRTSLLTSSIAAAPTGPAAAVTGAAAAAARARRQSSRTSIPRAGLDRRLIRYENTYRMDPNDENRVDLARLRRVASSVIETAIAGYKYDASQGKQFSLTLADRVRSQIKQLPFSRHKAVVQVVLGQKKGQDLRVASRCMWDLKWDRHMTITKETNDAYVSVTIFLVYTE
jgi:tctex1 domain-containing protein 2